MSRHEGLHLAPSRQPRDYHAPPSVSTQSESLTQLVGWRGRAPRAGTHQTTWCYTGQTKDAELTSLTRDALARKRRADMGLSYKVGDILPLLPGERVLHAQQGLRAMTIASFPSCGFAHRFWLCSISLRVTNRRCLVAFTGPFRLNHQEIDPWFPGFAPSGQTDLIDTVSVQHGLLGRCLQVKSTDPRRSERWCLSPDLSLRLYGDNVDELLEIITASMNQPGLSGVT